jgi:hypothetical protein
MTDPERLAERVEALERAVTDGHDPGSLPDRAALASRIDETDERTADLEARVDELEAAVEALRGYVGSVRAVNREVERRADAALAAVEEGTDRDALDDLDLDLDAGRGEDPDPGDGPDGGLDAVRHAEAMVDRVRDSL